MSKKAIIAAAAIASAASIQAANANTDQDTIAALVGIDTISLLEQKLVSMMEMIDGSDVNQQIHAESPHIGK